MILEIVASTGLLISCVPLIRLSHRLRFTTLVPAGYWVLVACALWFVTWILNYGFKSLSTAVADHLWYAIAVIALCPAIAVLGSRRPGTRVWTWFILIPMLFALGWPVMTLWIQSSEVRGLQLETPQLVGYLLVLVMGAGNYLGTRFTCSALLYMVGNGILVLSSSAACPPYLSDRILVRVWASCLLAGAILLAELFAREHSERRNRFDRLWIDFLNQFGVVWGRRIQDRVNFMAGREGWPVRLELHGFVWSSSEDSATESRMEHTLRWLLRRFVDPPWIDQRLGTQPAGQEVTALKADS